MAPPQLEAKATSLNPDAVEFKPGGWASGQILSVLNISFPMLTSVKYGLMHDVTKYVRYVAAVKNYQ